jgi:hypothetical protein
MAVMTFSYAFGNLHQMTYLERLALRQGLYSLKEAWQLSGTNKLHVTREGFEPIEGSNCTNAFATTSIPSEPYLIRAILLV